MASRLANVLCENAVTDVFMWRNKKISAAVLGGATAIWILFEVLEYYLLPLVCHLLISALVVLFIWSTAAKLIKIMSAPHIPDVELDERLVLQFAFSVRYGLNRALGVLRQAASGQRLKTFLAINFGLWILSVIGNLCNLLTLLYICFVLLHTIPVFYEKYGHKIDAYAEKAKIEMKKLYAVFDAKVLSKFPRRSLKDKKD